MAKILLSLLTLTNTAKYIHNNTVQIFLSVYIYTLCTGLYTKQ